MKLELLLIGMPFLVIILVCNMPDINKFSYLVIESDLKDIINKVFYGNCPFKVFQLIRFTVAFIMSIIVGSSSFSNQLLWALVTFVLTYKGIYLYLLFSLTNYYKRLNQEMPYFMKTIICLCYYQPVNNAFEKALTYANKYIKKDMQMLVDEIKNDPTSYGPYQNYIDKHQGKINNLDLYFKSLYRISISGNEKADKLLDSLNKNISEEINIIRNEKNNVTNDLIGYLGMIPVALLVIVLTLALILSIDIL